MGREVGLDLLPDRPCLARQRFWDLLSVNTQIIQTEASRVCLVVVMHNSEVLQIGQ